MPPLGKHNVHGLWQKNTAKKFYAGASVGCSFGGFIEDGWGLSLDAPLGFH